MKSKYYQNNMTNGHIRQMWEDEDDLTRLQFISDLCMIERSAIEKLRKSDVRAAKNMDDRFEQSTWPAVVRSMDINNESHIDPKDLMR